MFLLWFPTAQLCVCLSSINSPQLVASHDVLNSILFHSMLLGVAGSRHQSIYAFRQGHPGFFDASIRNTSSPSIIPWCCVGEALNMSIQTGVQTVSISGQRTRKFDFCQTRVCGLVSAARLRVLVCGLVCGVSAVFRLEVCWSWRVTFTWHYSPLLESWGANRKPTHLQDSSQVLSWPRNGWKQFPWTSIWSRYSPFYLP